MSDEVNLNVGQRRFHNLVYFKFIKEHIIFRNKLTVNVIISFEFRKRLSEVTTYNTIISQKFAVNYRFT